MIIQLFNPVNNDYECRIFIVIIFTEIRIFPNIYSI